MSGLALVYTLFPDEENARALIRSVLEDGLAACVNALPAATSFYQWEGETKESQEIPLILKTTAARVDALIERIEAMHPYAVPAILSWPAARAPRAFAQWVNETVHR